MMMADGFGNGFGQTRKAGGPEPQTPLPPFDRVRQRSATREEPHAINVFSCRRRSGTAINLPFTGGNPRLWETAG